MRRKNAPAPTFPSLQTAWRACGALQRPRRPSWPCQPSSSAQRALAAAAAATAFVAAAAQALFFFSFDVTSNKKKRVSQRKIGVFFSLTKKGTKKKEQGKLVTFSKEKGHGPLSFILHLKHPLQSRPVSLSVPVEKGERWTKVAEGVESVVATNNDKWTPSLSPHQLLLLLLPSFPYPRNRLLRLRWRRDRCVEQARGHPQLSTRRQGGESASKGGTRNGMGRDRRDIGLFVVVKINDRRTLPSKRKKRRRRR